MREPDAAEEPADERSSAMAGLRPLDRELLGLEPHPDDPEALSLVVVPHLCRTDGRFYGGAALAAALAASEAATGRPPLWSSTQLVAVADLGERVRIDVEILAAGRSVDQVQVRGTVGERLIFNAVGATGTGRAEGIHGSGQVMPRVPEPDECGDWMAKRQTAAGLEQLRAERPKVGSHLIVEHRDAPILDVADDRPGRMAMWTRLAGDPVPSPVQATPAMLGFFADMVPLAICGACGIDGAGTSLDNSVRIGEPVDSEWVLLDLDAEVAVGGFGHGRATLWSPDDRLLATGTQSARLFSIADFLAKKR